MPVLLTTSAPTNASTNIPLASTVSFVLETDTTLKLTELVVYIGGLKAVDMGVAQTGFTLSTSVSSIPGGQQATIFIVPSGTFNSFQNVLVSVSVGDITGTFNFTFSFTTVDVNAPVFTDITPAPNSINNSTNTPIFFRIKDIGSGVDLATLNVIAKSTTEDGTTVLGQILNGSITSGFGFDLTSSTFQIVDTDIDVFLRLLPIAGQDPYPSGALITIDAEVSDQAFVPATASHTETVTNYLNAGAGSTTNAWSLQVGFKAPASSLGSVTFNLGQRMGDTTPLSWDLYAAVPADPPNQAFYTMTGSVLATSSAVVMPSTAGLVTFAFNAVTTTPGAWYVLAPKGPTSGGFFFGLTSSATNADFTLSMPAFGFTYNDPYITVTSAQSQQTTLSYAFRIIDIEPPVISNRIPAPNSTNINEETNIALAITDPNGDGVQLSTVNIKINNIYAVRDGEVQSSYATLVTGSPIATGNGYYFIVDPINSLPSAQPTTVHVEAQDVRGTSVTETYSFLVRDFRAPQLDSFYPPNNTTHILPATNIIFTVDEDQDGYGVDFGTLSISINGQLINKKIIDGYESTLDGIGIVDGYNVQIVPFDGYGTFSFPPISNSLDEPLFRGFDVDIRPIAKNKYDIIINPYIDFDFESFIALQVQVADFGGQTNSASCLFQIAAQDQIVTTAYPDTGTYKNFLDGYGIQNSTSFLYNSGIELHTNLPNTRTFFTLDGSTPSIDRYGNTRGSTRFYSQPILLQRDGLHVLNFFSVDEAGNAEPMKQEIYMIAPLPAEVSPVTSIPIVADIVFATRIIPVESTSLFKENIIVKVLDDIRPPIVTKILSVNPTSSPPFIIVEDPVERLSSNFTTDVNGNLILKPSAGRNARVVLIQQPIDPLSPVDFDSTAVAENFYIGSDVNGLNQADSVLEQLRILNIASSDEEILADFTLLNKGARFVNQDSDVALSSTFSALEKKRSNLPNNTLVLLDFDGSIQTKPRQGTLKNNTTSIRDKVLASNTIVFTIYIQKNTFVDKELLKQVLRNFTPVDLQVKVNFIEID